MSKNPINTEERISPAGRYRLSVALKEMQKGWHYSMGTVFRADDDTPLFEVTRNFAAFPFCFVEGHPNGHDYLVCGADYQGQTILELDTGKRVDYLPEGYKNGVGFCWAEYQISDEKDILAVSGCFWGSPYDLRFIDFSQPMNPPFLILSEFPSADVNNVSSKPWSSGSIIRGKRYDEDFEKGTDFAWRRPSASEVLQYWQTQLDETRPESFFYADIKVQADLAAKHYAHSKGICGT